MHGQYGDSFYLLEIKNFEKNFENFLNVFTHFYKNVIISYSYKTNYIPALVKKVESLGGYAEVVSEMEFEIARKAGVPEQHIILNGPYKNENLVRGLLLSGGRINIDSEKDLEYAERLAQEFPERMIRIGIRCNYEIGDGICSRFGFDTENEIYFGKIIERIHKLPNLKISGLHSHFSKRSIQYWPKRIRKMLDIIEKWFSDEKLEYVSLGGGIYGIMEKSLNSQFNEAIPEYKDYAELIGGAINSYFSEKGYFPILFLEPGTALAGNIMKFYSKVVSIKEVRGKAIATLSGSIYNINPTLNDKNPPISVYSLESEGKVYENLDFGGYTCIETDYLYTGYAGTLSVGDSVEFRNVGSYSIVLKPPFILPNVPVIVIDNEEIVVKRSETFDDLFQTYRFG